MFGRYEIRSSNPTPLRTHYPWHALEEYRPDGGMWKIPAEGERAGFITESAALMMDAAKFADSMRYALDEWPLSVSVALTNPGLNRRAWLGHAGCYLATGSPEETTRLGWHTLDEWHQREANAAADRVITEWQRAQRDDSNEGEGALF